jgi:mannose-6-phosphate isomerase-like protein (cupin superfamily)
MQGGRIARVGAALTLGLAVAAQPAGESDPLRGFKHRAEIEALVRGLREGTLTGPQALFAREGGPYRVYTSFIDGRKGAADIHATDDEIFVVLSGEADCTLGGDIADKTLARPHEYRGTRIAGGITSRVGPGDIVSAPRGTAHQMDPGAGHVLYIVIKVAGAP